MMNRREMGKMLAIAAGALVAGANGFGAESKMQAQGTRPTNDPVGADTLLSEPLPEMQNAEVRMVLLTIAPGGMSPPHRHTGPVFAYILEGSIQNQVEPGPPEIYKAGDFFYEPSMHVHRQFRNLSAKESAKVLAIEVRDKNKDFTISV
jgi:quercetin dioxygenase-like cupin family protein